MRKILLPAALAMALLGAACSGPGDATADDGTTTVQVGTFGQSLTSILEVVAAEEGMMSERGIDFQLNPFTSAADMYPALLSGDLDYVPLSPNSGWPLAEQGQCFSWFMAETGSQYSLIALDDLDVTPSDDPAVLLPQLAGKRIGVTARGVPMEEWLLESMADAGMSEGDVTFIGSGSLSSSIPALENGEIDVVLGWPGFTTRMAEPSKTLMKLYGPDSAWSDLLQVGSAVTCDYRETNPEVTKNICEGMHEAFDFATDPANKKRMGELVAETLDVDGEEGQKLWDEYSTILTSPDLTEQVWADQASFVTVTDFVPEYASSVVQDCTF